ncbi:MAG: hypothetical protein QF915_04605, partial [Candidatus Woesearchaeota archaeon]|nr:hypothetical protein [Candidatus Woesearchaeota archaeon]
MRVLKRKKGKKDYYYLQYSYRSRGKIITKEKYLGKEIPKNINELKQSFFREEQGEIYGKFEQIKNHFQKEWKRIPASVRQQELEELSIAFTYNTNAIEGSTITLEEARTIIHDKVAPHKPLYDVKETEAHSKILLEMLEKKDKISQDLLL